MRSIYLYIQMQYVYGIKSGSPDLSYTVLD